MSELLRLAAFAQSGIMDGWTPDLMYDVGTAGDYWVFKTTDSNFQDSSGTVNVSSPGDLFSRSSGLRTQGSGFDLVQGDPGQAPAWDSGLEYSTASSWLIGSSPSNLSNSETSVFFVAEASASAISYWLAQAASGTLIAQLGADFGSSGNFKFRAGNVVSGNVAIPTDSSVHTYQMVSDSSNSQWLCYQDGALIATVSAGSFAAMSRVIAGIRGGLQAKLLALGVIESTISSLDRERIDAWGQSI